MLASWQSLLFNTSYVLFYQTSRTALVPTHPIHQVPRFLSSAVKRPALEDDHSPPFSAMVKYEWSYTSTSHLHVFKECIQMIMLRILVNLYCIPLDVLLQPSQSFALYRSYIVCVLIIQEPSVSLYKDIILSDPYCHFLLAYSSCKIQPSQSCY